MASCISVAATGGGGSDKGADESDWSEAPRLGEDGEEDKEEDDGNAGDAAMESGSLGGNVRRNASQIAANCPPEDDDDEDDDDEDDDDDESAPPPWTMCRMIQR